MGRVIICDTKEAKKPYCIKAIGKNVFSYEELCYYMYNNVVLLLDTFIDEELMNWLENELLLKELVGKLNILMNANVSQKDIMVCIMQEKGYYSEFEIKDFSVFCNKLEMMTKEQVLKEKAEAYLRNSFYLKALDLYDEILEIHQKNRLDSKFLSKVYHNKGVCLAYNMELLNAKENFLKAIQLLKEEQSIKAYILLLYILGEKISDIRKSVEDLEISIDLYAAIIDDIEEQEKKIEYCEEYKRLEKAIYNKEHGEVGQYYKSLDTIMDSWKYECKNQIM